MTLTADNDTKLVSELISSCHKAQDGYRSAAKSAEDSSLKRLFEIYAQQRTRFAAELREYLPVVEGWDVQTGDAEEPDCAVAGANRLESIRECLAIDAQTLSLYKEALAERALPTRAHFLISSQMALLQRVHDRMKMMLQERPAARPVLAAQRISA